MMFTVLVVATCLLLNATTRLIIIDSGCSNSNSYDATVNCCKLDYAKTNKVTLLILVTLQTLLGSGTIHFLE